MIRHERPRILKGMTALHIIPFASSETVAADLDWLPEGESILIPRLVWTIE